MTALPLDSPDPDGDGAVDLLDNCVDAANTDQRNSDGDSYGNICDADLNNDGMVHFQDMGLLKARFFTSDSAADLNGDGTVDFLDLGLMKELFFLPPGP